jgi:hypothetical protein
VEYRGITSQIRTLAGHLEPDAIILFDDERPVGVGVTVGTPLQYLFGFTAFDLVETNLKEEVLRLLIEVWHHQGRTVYWVVGPQPALGLPDWLSLEPALGEWIRTERLETSYFDRPEKRVPYTVPLEFYRVISDAGRPFCDLPALVDIGSLDTLYIETGFHDKEALGDRTVRWTDGAGTLKLPCMAEAGSGSPMLTVTAAAIRPAGMAPAGMIPSLDGQPLGRFILGSEFEEFRMPLPPSFSATGGVLTLESDTWVPAEAGVGGDARTLGILIDSVQIWYGDRSE